MEFISVYGAWMVAQAGVHAVEDAVPDHEDLAHQGLLSGTPEALHRSGNTLGLHGSFGGEGASERSRGVAMMAAAVPRSALHEGLSARHCLLRDPGERVELAHDADDGFARTVGGGEGRGHPCNTSLDDEAVLLKDIGEQLAGLELLKAHLGPFPYRVMGTDEQLLVLINPIDRNLFRVRGHSHHRVASLQLLWLVLCKSVGSPQRRTMLRRA
jgi:hypothetical protein